MISMLSDDTERLKRTMYGVITAMIVFQSQLEAVERATPRDLMGRGKTSPIKIQAPGPQVEAKKKMKMAMKAIWALTAEMLLARVRGSPPAGLGMV